MEIDLTRMSEPQREFFLSDAKYTCYGGARGGGKSWGMRTLLVLNALKYAYIYRELCKPDVIIADAARMILDASANEPVLNTFAPADMWARNRATGRGQAEMFAEAGLILTQVRNSRIDGWLSLKDWMRPIDNGTGEKRPRLQIFSTCRRLIHDLPLLQHDEHNPTDVSTQPHDITHAPDSLRYLLDGRPQHRVIVPQEYDSQIDSFLDYGG